MSTESEKRLHRCCFSGQRPEKLPAGEEAAAINCHMGFSDGNPNAVRDVGNAYHQFPLAWIVHVADEAATFLLER